MGRRDTQSASGTIAVIGAGIVGTVCAHRLRADGHDVVLIDKGLPGSGTSHGNAGSLSPGSIVPLALPGTVRSIPGWLANPLGPLSVAPGQVAQLLPWLVRFWRSGRADRVVPVVRAMQSLNRGCVDAFAVLLAEAQAPELLTRHGMLHVYRSEKAFGASAYARKLRTDHGVEVQVCDAKEIRDRIPALAHDYRFGFFLPEGGHVRNPQRVVTRIADRFVALGGRLLQATVHDFLIRDGRVAGIVTQANEIPAAQVVLAAGVASTGLARRLGIRVPIVAERGYHIELPEARISLDHPVTDAEAKCVATPMEGGLRIAGTSEFTGAGTPPNWKRATVLERNARAMLPGVGLEQLRRWVGSRPSTPDSLPIICNAPGHPDIVLAFGHGHWGLMAAPSTAGIVADLIAGRPAAFDLAPFHVSRFGSTTFFGR